METIFKTWQKATYIQGTFQLRENRPLWGSPIQFPIVFVAYGAGIKSGNWQRWEAINTPEYVINNYFSTIGHEKHHLMYKLWLYCNHLSGKTWEDIYDDADTVLELIRLANIELGKLDTLT